MIGKPYVPGDARRDSLHDFHAPTSAPSSLFITAA
jgi:hypothetical protein